MENQEERKTVNAIATSPVTAEFDIVEIGEKKSQVVRGIVRFTDQFGIERAMDTMSERGIRNIGQIVLEIFAGNMKVIPPADQPIELKDGSPDQAPILNAYDQTK